MLSCIFVDLKKKNNINELSTRLLFCYIAGNICREPYFRARGILEKNDKTHGWSWKKYAALYRFSFLNQYQKKMNQGIFKNKQPPKRKKKILQLTKDKIQEFVVLIWFFLMPPTTILIFVEMRNGKTEREGKWEV